MNSVSRNPFSVKTPEGLPAAEATRLFVDVFTDFNKVIEPGHCMVNGPRGCGKSMMFRFLQPDCQLIDRKCEIQTLPFFAVLVSIKNTSLNLTELRRLQDEHANITLNEHFLTMFVASRIFETLAKLELHETEKNINSAREFFETFVGRLARAGWTEDPPRLPSEVSLREVFRGLKRLCEEQYVLVLTYVRGLSFHSPGRPSFSGPLCGYIDFLFPVFEELQALPFMTDGPVYLLIDDADYLNRVQTLILNSWISTRTSATVSIKVSTQLRYKSFQTVYGIKIASPHDYADVRIADLYTTSKGKYLSRVREIVAKRLNSHGLEGATPEEFFPQNEAQEAKIKAIAARLRANWEESGHGYRPNDDALRYARPTYIAELKGPRKAGSTYCHAGFDQLVHISSGLIRFFLEPAAVMYSEEQSECGGAVTSISPTVQDRVIRKAAEDLMFDEYDNLFKDEEELVEEAVPAGRLKDRKHDLHKLLRVLGGIFHLKLISEDRERRVFSIAFSDTPPPEIEELFSLGVQLGYFHRTSIGNKDGTGRTPLFVLTRRLAPYFMLDPSGFAGYLFATSDRIREAIANPDSFLRKLKQHKIGDYFEERQLKLFE